MVCGRMRYQWWSCPHYSMKPILICGQERFISIRRGDGTTRSLPQGLHRYPRVLLNHARSCVVHAGGERAGGGLPASATDLWNIRVRRLPRGVLLQRSRVPNVRCIAPRTCIALGIRFEESSSTHWPATIPVTRDVGRDRELGRDEGGETEDTMERSPGGRPGPIWTASFRRSLWLSAAPWGDDRGRARLCCECRS